jgi:hypothetical protein
LITYAICIFLSAYLLFQIQPIISKTLLPWFGGTPAVWSSAMLFFQIVLTGGYAYSNWLVRKLNAKKQAITHLFLLGISVCLVISLWIVWPSPITPSVTWRSVPVIYPIPTIFLLLVISIGLPFFVLTTNSPLMQAWANRKDPGKSPYWLYALSNIGSILGLLAYPLVVEPMLPLTWQGRIWTAGYILFVILAGTNAILTYKSITRSGEGEKEVSVPDSQKPQKKTQILWLLLSACAALMVLAVTNQITQEVAAIPFLWVLPLTIYLLSFVLTFSGKAWYRRKLFTFLMLLGTFGWFFVTINPSPDFILEIILYNFLLFAATMVCHGELYALRPPASQLTRFYLMVSVGGALGGILVNLVAPILFRGYWELYFGVAFIWIIITLLLYKQESTKSGSSFSLLFSAIATLFSCVQLVSMIYFSLTENVVIYRNFYGVVHVRQGEIETIRKDANTLVHGSTVHGFQFLDPEIHNMPTSYYTRDSGISLAILNHPRHGSGMRVGILGLGTGTMAAYGQPGDYYRFYEINPDIINLANGQGGYFSFLADSQASIDIIPGDARISLEQEVTAEPGNDFDVLVLDTFSSDSIPVHLVTREAFDIYLQNLSPDGLIAANISNTRLDLRPVFWQLARYYDMEFAAIDNPAKDESMAALPSTWVLLTWNSKLLEAPALANRITQGVDFRTDIPLWTDDYSNLIQLLK